MRRLSISLALVTLGAIQAPAHGQVVRITAGRIVPFEGLGVGKKDDAASRRSANAIAMYATAFLGSPGAIGDVQPGERVAFRYETLHLLFSAAALPQPRPAEVIPSGNLRQVNGHVTIVPLDSAMQPIEDQSALAVLATFPDTILVATGQTAADSVSSGVGGAAFGAVARTVFSEVQAGELVAKRLGKMIVSFKDLFHRPSARLQVAYVSELREFGWMWYEHAGTVIEGTHRTTAALELAPNVRHLMVRMRIIADWKSHGAWERDMELVLEVARPTAGGTQR